MVVVYHLVPTSNHNKKEKWKIALKLFIILFLHQTTTSHMPPSIYPLLFIILFLHQTTTMLSIIFFAHSLFIILFLHQTTTSVLMTFLLVCCLSSCSYIKPQLSNGDKISKTGCLSSCSYIKPQPCLNQRSNRLRCLSSCSYIKPQLFPMVRFRYVCCLSSCSYIKPQLSVFLIMRLWVVYHLVPTSNHNILCKRIQSKKLFIILFLHQTTTINAL